MNYGRVTPLHVAHTCENSTFHPTGFNSNAVRIVQPLIKMKLRDGNKFLKATKAIMSISAPSAL